MKSDFLAIVDLGIPSADTPAITLGIRGLVSLELKLTGSNTDLHSGCHGGIAFNPLHALVQILASLRDTSGRITIPGFYDTITPLSPADTVNLELSFDEKAYSKEFDATPSEEKSPFLQKKEIG